VSHEKSQNPGSQGLASDRHEILQFSLVQLDINHNNLVHSGCTPTCTFLHICHHVSPEIQQLREKITTHQSTAALTYTPKHSSPASASDFASVHPHTNHTAASWRRWDTGNCCESPKRSRWSCHVSTKQPILTMLYPDTQNHRIQTSHQFDDSCIPLSYPKAHKETASTFPAAQEGQPIKATPASFWMEFHIAGWSIQAISSGTMLSA